MQMEIFEYVVIAENEVVAGFSNLERATKYAFKASKRERCDTDVVNAFTGEVHKSYSCHVHIIYNADYEELEKYYEVKERV